MSLLQKIFTAARGAATETGEAIVDNQALRILDQEMRDANVELRKAKDALTEVMAKRKLAANKVADYRSTISNYENHALQALNQGNEALATEVAERIAQIEADLSAEEALVQEFQRSENSLRNTIGKTEAGLKRMQQQVHTVKATAAVQKAQAAVAARHSGANSSMQGALGSLERIRQRQTEQAARFEAAEELENASGTNDLDAKLAAAGIGNTAGGGNDVLARLKARQG
jgi:phage shock protein A